MISLLKLPAYHWFYLDYNSHPIALAPGHYQYKLIETRVERVKEETKEYYLFKYLVEPIR